MTTLLKKTFEQVANATLSLARQVLTSAREYTESATQGFANFLESAAQIAGVQPMSMATAPVSEQPAYNRPGTKPQ